MFVSTIKRYRHEKVLRIGEGGVLMGSYVNNSDVRCAYPINYFYLFLNIQIVMSLN